MILPHGGGEDKAPSIGATSFNCLAAFKSPQKQKEPYKCHAIMGMKNLYETTTVSLVARLRARTSLDKELPMNIFLLLAIVCWIVFFAYWTVKRFGNKKIIRRQSFSSRLITKVLTTAGFFLMFLPDLSFGFTGWRFVPMSPVIGAAGVVVCACGVGFAIWARRTLGRNWSGVVTVKENHELITNGPYRFVRHPIYTGMLLAVLGTVIVVGEVRALVALALFFLAFLGKMRQEERFMESEFPDAYPKYRRRVRALIPYLF
jgi:protein-S-isoprenylcysteine O-methyltransferase Ste14